MFLRHRIEGFGGSGGTGVAVPTGGRGRGGDSPSPMLDGAPIGPLLVKSRGGGVGSGRGGLARWFGGVRYTSLGSCLPGAALGVPDVPLPSVCPATRGFLVHGPLGGSPVRVHPSRGLASVRDRRARRRRDRVGVLNAALADGRGGGPVRGWVEDWLWLSRDEPPGGRGPGALVFSCSFLFLNLLVDGRNAAWIGGGLTSRVGRSSVVGFVLSSYARSRADIFKKCRFSANSCGSTAWDPIFTQLISSLMSRDRGSSPAFH